IDNLSANFQQESLDKNEKLLQKQIGRFVVKRSGEFFWYVNPPYEQHIFSDGGVVKIYDPDLEQLTIKSIDQKTQMIPLLLFSDNAQKIIEQYTVNQIKEGKNPAFELIPITNGHFFDRLIVVFLLNPDGHVPQRLEITDSLKQKTRVHFDNAVLNQPLDPGVFMFSIPEGIDV